MIPAKVEFNGQDITHLVSSVGLSSPLHAEYRRDGTLEAIQFEYMAMTRREREDIEAWCRTHNVAPSLVPVSARIGYDPETDEWRIPVFVRGPEGGIRMNAARDDVLRRVVRRRRQPWPPAESVPELEG